MKILFFNWGYTKLDIKEALNNMGIIYELAGYSFADKNHDDFFEYRFSKLLADGKFDAVLSVNFFPLIAKCCYKYNLKYISWSYDNPLNVPYIEETLGLETNYVFMFDRTQVQNYTDKGFDNVFHMPLAVNTSRLDKIVMTKAEKERFSTDLSFVGKLYDSDYQKICSAMSDYQRGYTDSLIKAQSFLYGCYLLDTALSDEIVTEINEHAHMVYPNMQGNISKQAMLYAMAAQTTKEERLVLLSLLSAHFNVKLYSREWNQMLKNVEFAGSCGYIDEMPRIFKASRINLNISYKMIQSGIPLRCLDVMGAGGFLLSNYQPELFEFFEAGREFVMYESAEDAYEKASYYLKHETERQKVVIAGYEKAKREFSYEKKLITMFEIAGII